MVRKSAIIELMSKEKEVGRSAFRFSLGTLFSRVSGMTREMTMAYVLGTTPAAAAFLVAFRFAYLLRRLFGEGAIVNGFVPHYEALKNQNEKNASLFFRDLFCSMGLLLIGIIGLLELVLFFTMHHFHMQEGNREIVRLIMLSLPGLLFICLFALHTGFLQCQGRFFLTGVAPVVFNLAWIGSLLFYRNEEASIITSHLALALDVAFLLQWLILLPATWKKLQGLLTFYDLRTFKPFSSEIRRLLTTLSLSVIGVSAIQVNGFIDVLFARAADLQGPAYLTYAIRFQQLPLALFGIAISSAIFPALSRALENREEMAAEELLRFGLMRSSCLMIPCTFGIFLLGGPAINLLFGHGHFTEQSTFYTTLCLWAYGIGLMPTTILLLFSQAFFARHDFKTPMFLSLGTIAFNAGLNALFIYGCHWGAVSVAVATSFTSAINAFILYFLYKKRYGMGFFREKRRPLIQLLLCSLVATAACFFTSSWLGDTSFWEILNGQLVHFPHHLATQGIQLFLPSVAFAITFIAMSFAIRCEEVLGLLPLVARKILKRN
jgi:putative peptidoglycan lipid II flippase